MLCQVGKELKSGFDARRRPLRGCTAQPIEAATQDHCWRRVHRRKSVTTQEKGTLGRIVSKLNPKAISALLSSCIDFLGFCS